MSPFFSKSCNFGTINVWVKAPDVGTIDKLLYVTTTIPDRDIPAPFLNIPAVDISTINTSYSSFPNTISVQTTVPSAIAPTLLTYNVSLSASIPNPPMDEPAVNIATPVSISDYDLSFIQEFSLLPYISIPINVIYPNRRTLTNIIPPNIPLDIIPDFPYPEFEALPDITISESSFRNIDVSIQANGRFFEKVGKVNRVVHDSYRTEYDYFKNLYLDIMATIDEFKSPDLLRSKLETLIIKERTQFRKHLSDKEIALIKLNTYTKVNAEYIKAQVLNFKTQLEQAAFILMDTIKSNKEYMDLWDIFTKFVLTEAKINTSIANRNSDITSFYTALLQIGMRLIGAYNDAIEDSVKLETLNIEYQALRQRAVASRLLSDVPHYKLPILNSQLQALQSERDAIQTKLSVIQNEVTLLNEKATALQQLVNSFNLELSSLATLASSETRLATANANIELISEKSSMQSRYANYFSDLMSMWYRLQSQAKEAFYRGIAYNNANKVFSEEYANALKLVSSLKDNAIKLASAREHYQEKLISLYRDISNTSLVTEVIESYSRRYI